MPSDNQSEIGPASLFGPDGSPLVDRLIEETMDAMENAKAFLSRLSEEDTETRRYLENITGHLENDLKRLERELKEKEPKSGS